MYATLTVDGTLTKHSGIPKYADLRDGVGGYVEAVRLDDDREGDETNIGSALMWLNEEGKLEGLPLNRLATDLAHAFRSIFPNDHIVGNVVFTGLPDNEGETTSLPVKWWTYLSILREQAQP